VIRRLLLPAGKPSGKHQQQEKTETQKELVRRMASFVMLQTEYDGVSKSFQTESITNYTLTTINTR